MATADSIKLYIAEEQQILKEAYQAFFQQRQDIELVGASDDMDGDSLARAALTYGPQVMILGFKTLQPATIAKLDTVRERCANVALVLLSAYYDMKGIKALREFAARCSTAGCAYLLKHTISR